jgi:hypothetical protein
MCLRPLAVVRLKRTLTHFRLQMRCSVQATLCQALLTSCGIPWPPATVAAWPERSGDTAPAPGTTPGTSAGTAARGWVRTTRACCRPGNRISTAPARWPVDQPRWRCHAGQTVRPGPAAPGAARFAGRCLEHGHLANAPRTESLGCGETDTVPGRGPENPYWALETTQGDQVRPLQLRVQPVDRTSGRPVGREVKME